MGWGFFRDDNDHAGDEALRQQHEMEQRQHQEEELRIKQEEELKLLHNQEEQRLRFEEEEKLREREELEQRERERRAYLKKQDRRLRDQMVRDQMLQGRGAQPQKDWRNTGTPEWSQQSQKDDCAPPIAITRGPGIAMVSSRHAANPGNTNVGEQMKQAHLEAQKKMIEDLVHGPTGGRSGEEDYIPLKRQI